MIFTVWLGAILVLLFLFFLWNNWPAPQKSALGIEGELLFADQGVKSRAFVSKKYGIRAKPDFLIRLKDGRVALVEYKSRSNGRIYESDIMQAKASVLAAREVYPVEVMFIKAGTRIQQVPIPRDSDSLYREVERYAELVRRANKGELIREFCSNQHQCKTCSVQAHCQR